jgi:hypothetical protein
MCLQNNPSRGPIQYSQSTCKNNSGLDLGAGVQDVVQGGEVLDDETLVSGHHLKPLVTPGVGVMLRILNDFFHTLAKTHTLNLS